jgi:hypothetical protein
MSFVNALTWQPSEFVYWKEYAEAKVTQAHFRFKMFVPPKKAIKIDWVEVDTKGRVTLNPYFVWDGASGPTIDTIGTIRASLVHDVLYRLIRLGHLDQTYKDVADNLLYDFMIADGVAQIRAFAWLKAVRLFGHDSIKPENENNIYRAPKPFPGEEKPVWNNPLVGRPA